MFMELFQSLVRGHLEYANTVWAPIRLVDIDHLEKVQQQATKLVPEIRQDVMPTKIMGTKTSKPRVQKSKRGYD